MNVKRCSGYKGHWECGKDYPDHMVPVNKFGFDSKNGFQRICKKCESYRHIIRTPTRPRHPDTGRLKIDWITSKAKEYYGGMSKDRRNDAHWKECTEKSKLDSQSIDWVINKKIKSKTKELTYDNVIQYVETKSKGRKRDAKVVSYIRSVYDSCSVVGCDYQYYEVAHIHALKHGADDLPENCLALCPNHHKDLDNGRMINLQQLDVGGYIYFGEEDDRKGIKLKHKVDHKNLDQCNIELENWKNAINKIQSGNDRPSIAMGK